MSEYDSKMVFVPIRKLQELRGMVDPTTGVGSFNVIQIRLRPGADGNVVRDKLKNAFSAGLYDAYTWRDNKMSLLAAVEMETRILNILLFMIIAVAGFGILAIFSMIVMEKTRDIGILKSLGASKSGVMGIFMSYGLLLGLVGSGAGLVGGLLFVRYINRIADFVGWLTGRPVFPPQIYYFYKIPTVVMPATVAWIVVGTIMIAIVASILPARRAAGLHPVEALRYE
jgi:lipoprotein-releasing system permease protein